jgi:hypothetical protein
MRKLLAFGLLALLGEAKADERKIGVVYVDPQVDFLKYLPRDEKNDLNNQLEVLKWASINDIPVVVFLYSERAGPIIDSVQSSLEDVPRYIVISKEGNDGFTTYLGYQDPESWLRERDVNTLVVMGGYTGRCVISSARSAKIRGFNIETSPELVVGYKTQEDNIALEWFKLNGEYQEHYEDLLVIK